MTGVPDGPADIGVGLAEVIAAVWCPDQTGVRVRVGRPGENLPCDESYFVLPNPRHPRLLLPADDVTSARRALRAYRGLRTARAEAWSRLIRASVLSTPTASRVLRQLHVHADAGADRLIPRLSELAGHPGPLRALLAVRRPAPASKPTLGLVDLAGHPVCYAKVGRSSMSDALVRTEAATLRALTGRLPTIITPTLVAETDWNSHPVTMLGPLPGDARRLTAEPFEMADTLWEVAASGDLRAGPLAGSSYQARLQHRLDACDRSHPAVVRLLNQWSRLLCADPGPLRFGRSHGDWVSWNLGTHAGRVVVWDWEQSVPDAPVGFDACHWYFQRTRAAKGLLAAAAAVDAIAPGLVRVGVAADDAARVAQAYLVDAFLAEVESVASGGSGGDLSVIVQVARRRLLR